MFVDIEETLGRELREVAGGLHIPALPPLPQRSARARRQWQPLLVAAAVVLVVAAVVTVVASARGGQEPEPAPPAPSRTESVGRIPTTAPTVPYVLDQQLYVGGERVPGTWWSVWVGEAAWLALRTDDTWWGGRGAEPNEITGLVDVPPVISPNGQYVAEVRVADGGGLLTGLVTTAGGEELAGVPLDLGDRQDGSAVTIRAVTNDGKVIAQGTKSGLLWLPLAGNRTVDLSVTAPGQQIMGSTPAGLVVTDGEGGEAYLAEISDAGELTPIGALPAHDSLEVSPGAEWLAWTAPGTMGGEVTELPALEAQTVDGSRLATLDAPAGWAFRVQAWVWEDDDHLVSPVVGAGGAGGEWMARCGVQSARCVLISAR